MKKLNFLLLLLFVASVPFSVMAQDDEKFKTAYASIGSIKAPIWLAKHTSKVNPSAEPLYSIKSTLIDLVIERGEGIVFKSDKGLLYVPAASIKIENYITETKQSLHSFGKGTVDSAIRTDIYTQTMSRDRYMEIMNFINNADTLELFVRADNVFKPKNGIKQLKDKNLDWNEEAKGFLVFSFNKGQVAKAQKAIAKKFEAPKNAW